MNDDFGNSGTPLSGTDERLHQLVEEYSHRLAAGECLTPEEFIAQHPGYADQLVDLLPAASVMAAIGSEVKRNRLADGVIPQALGDFRIVREIGRGGMGIVYEAIQLSLNRRVALKVLPFAHMLDASRLQRFKNEAHAAATLFHPNIVNAFFVGHERGVHFYAMRYIDGVSLADIIATRSRRHQHGQKQSHKGECNDPSCVPAAPTLVEPHSTCAAQEAWRNETHPIARLTTERGQHPSSYFRTVARLGFEAADALHHAHCLGIVHRDVKPSNLLVDEHLHLWITDFGLAATQTSVSLTMTGNLLGTLRYMSPEQAAGEVDVPSASMDVYSLGATLYELLSGRPVHDEDNPRQLLRRIADAEPPSLRSLDARIPRDLETIVHKALAKRAADRYPSAAKMADDLRRFLELRPIQARRIRWNQRLVRYTQRNRLLSILLVVSFILMTMLSIGGPLLAIRYSRAAGAEVHARAAANRNLNEVKRILSDSLVDAVGTLNDMPGTSELRRRLAQNTYELCQRLLPQSAGDPQVQFQIARGLIVLGDEFPHRDDAFKTAIEILERLTRQHSMSQEYLVALTDAYAKFGAMQLHVNASQGAVYLQRSLDARNQLDMRFGNVDLPPWCYSRSRCHYYLARTFDVRGMLVQARPQFELAERYAWEQSCRWPEKVEARLEWANARANLAESYALTGSLSEAEAILRECVGTCESMLPIIRATSNGRLRYLDDVVGPLASVVLARRGTQDAEAILLRSIDELSRYVDDFPSDGWGIMALTEQCGQLSDAYLAMERNHDAEQTLREAITRLESLKALVRADEVGWAKYRMGLVLWWSNRHDEARQHFATALASLRMAREPRQRRNAMRMTVILTTCPATEFRQADEALMFARQAFHPEDGGSARLLGWAQYHAGDLLGARQSLEQGIRKICGGDAFDFLLLSIVCTQLGDSAASKSWYDKAIARFDHPFVQTSIQHCYANPLALRELRAEADALIAARR